MSTVMRVSADRLDELLDPTDGRFWLVLRDFGVNPEGIHHVIVSFFREGLTDEDCIEKLQGRGDDPDESQTSCFDIDHS